MPKRYVPVLLIASLRALTRRGAKGHLAHLERTRTQRVEDPHALLRRVARDGGPVAGHVLERLLWFHRSVSPITTFSSMLTVHLGRRDHVLWVRSSPAGGQDGAAEPIAPRNRLSLVCTRACGRERREERLIGWCMARVLRLFERWRGGDVRTAWLLNRTEARWRSRR